MPWSFDPSALATNELMAVRLEIADTDPLDPLLPDEGIAWAISQERNFWSACARCAEIIARGFLRKADVKLGRSLTIQYRAAAQQYFEMATTLRRKSMGTVVPWVGGQFVADKILYSQDTTLVQPAMTRTMLENPWTGGYTSDSLDPVGGGHDDDDFDFT